MNPVLPPIEPQWTQPIREVVYERLKEALLEGRLRPGDRLVESELAQRLQVSRTPVREALRRLEAEGMLESLPRKGLVVKDYSLEEIEEVYAIRESLEALAAVQAVRRATEEELRHLEALMARIDLLERDPRTPPRGIFEAHRDFSEACIRACHLPRLVQMIETFKGHMTRFRRVTLGDDARRRRVRDEHRSILEALKNRDEALAERLTREHIRGAYEAYFGLAGSSAPTPAAPPSLQPASEEVETP